MGELNETSQFLIRHGLPLAFAVVLVEQMELPIPALPLLLAAGALSADGKFSFPLGIAATVIACLIPDAFWFYLGRYRGNQVLNFFVGFLLNPTRVSVGHKMYSRDMACVEWLRRNLSRA